MATEPPFNSAGTQWVYGWRVGLGPIQATIICPSDDPLWVTCEVDGYLGTIHVETLSRLAPWPKALHA